MHEYMNALIRTMLHTHMHRWPQHTIHTVHIHTCMHTYMCIQKLRIAQYIQYMHVSLHTHTHSTVQYNTLQYNTVQYSTVQYDTIQYNTVQYNTEQYNTQVVQCNTLCHNTAQYNTVHYGAAQYRNANTIG